MPSEEHQCPAGVRPATPAGIDGAGGDRRRAWIAPTATLVGDVRVEAEASIWYGAVLRADFGPIIVRRGANVQDGSVLHGGALRWVRTNPATYRDLARRHAAGVRPVSGSE